MQTKNNTSKERQARFSMFENRRLLVVILVLAVFLSYANIITGKFVWDDQTIVVRNKAITSFEHVPYIFKNEFSEMCKYNGNVYRPIQELSYMVDHFLWGLDATGFHVTNVLLQIICTILLFYLVLNISGSRIAAFITAIIFGIHPINTEAVSYVSGRSDPLAFLFLLSSFLFYIKARGANKKEFLMLYIPSLFFYGLSLISRESVVIFPLLLLAYERWIKEEKIDWLKVLPFFALLGCYIFLRLNFIELNRQ